MVYLLAGPKGTGKTQQMIEQANAAAKKCNGNVVFIKKTESGMRLPKRCVACRKKRRSERDPYAGWLSTLGRYPATKGHRHSVHGGR